MRQADFCAHVDRLCSARLLQDHRHRLSDLPQLGMDERSAIAKLCRAQCYPSTGTVLDQMTKCLHPDFRRDILPLCQTPLMAGLLLHLVMAAPMDEREVSRLYYESMIKEMRVMESVMRDTTINFEPFFGDYDDSIHSSLPPNGPIARYIHSAIDTWIESLTERTLFPTVGSKTVSKQTAEQLVNTCPEYELNDTIGVTPIDLERVYHEYGLKIPGPCEMRQKWYYSQLKPRTYYAQGGDAYHTSKYLAKPLVDLCDTLPATNRRTRTDPGRIVIDDPTDDVVYYDLTSFTSNMHVHRVFMMRLAHYCRGTVVDILDSVHGPASVDLGELIASYTVTNLCDPSYIVPSQYGDQSVLHYHGIAGFLGVYGNIASATFIHGIVMAMRHSRLDKNNVAGDDGLDVTKCVDDTLRLAGEVGEVHKDKTFRDSDGCCIHLKRPIRRIGERLYLGQLVPWPSMEPTCGDVDDRYPYLRLADGRERREMIASSITAFLRTLESYRLTDDELDLVDSFLSHTYCTNRLPLEGNVPQVAYSQLGFVPIYERRFIGIDPIQNTLERHYAGIARLPKRGKLRLEVEMLSMPKFECNSTPLLRHLVLLGYLEQEKTHECVFGEEGLSRLIAEYMCPDPIIYGYTVLCELPSWTVTLLA